MDDEQDDDWSLDYDKNRLTRIKLKRLKAYKEAHEGYGNKAQKLAAYLTEQEQEMKMREAMIPANIAARDKLIAKMKRTGLSFAPK